VDKKVRVSVSPSALSIASPVRLVVIFYINGCLQSLLVQTSHTKWSGKDHPLEAEGGGTGCIRKRTNTGGIETMELCSSGTSALPYFRDVSQKDDLQDLLQNPQSKGWWSASSATAPA
jgi:hypothetical protein